MKNKMIRRMRVILVLAVVFIAVSVFLSVWFTLRSAMTNDMIERSIGVKDYILSRLEYEDFAHINEDSEAGIRANVHIQSILSDLRGVGNLKRLYIAKIDSGGNILSSKRVMPDDPDSYYLPTGRLEADLRHSYAERVAVYSNGVYSNDDSDIYYIFWPVMDQNLDVLGVVSMEFDFGAIHESRDRALIIAICVAGALTLLIYVVASLSMSRATEPYFKKLAYTDFLTGYENRMAFEHRLRVCGDLAAEGKSVTMIVFDLNNLKKINDSLGHKAGDAYVANTADIIFDNLRGVGPLYRIGGDEFATLIVGKDERAAESVMESLRREDRPAFERYPFSCAFGAATFTKGVDETMRDVFKRADDAMYEEKKRQKAGRG